MSSKAKKTTIPSKEDLVSKLMEVVDGYDGTTDSAVRPTDAIRAIEVLNKMLGYNEAEKQEMEVKQLTFKLGNE